MAGKQHFDNLFFSLGKKIEKKFGSVEKKFIHLHRKIETIINQPLNIKDYEQNRTC